MSEFKLQDAFRIQRGEMALPEGAIKPREDYMVADFYSEDNQGNKYCTDGMQVLATRIFLKSMPELIPYVRALREFQELEAQAPELQQVV